MGGFRGRNRQQRGRRRWSGSVRGGGVEGESHGRGGGCGVGG